MGVLADVLYFINIPRLLTPRRRAPIGNYLFISVLFMTSLLLTLVFYTKMFWIDIVLVSVFVLLFLFMFYSIARNKVDLEDEYIERKIILDERKKANNSTKMVDLERQLKTASASERRSIKRELIKLKQKNNATSQDQNRIFDSSLLQDVQDDVKEADRNDLDDLERIERENQMKLNQLSSEQDVEKDNMKINEIASLMATQKNIQDLKNKKVGYDKRKDERINKAVGTLKEERDRAENQLRDDEEFLRKKKDQVKRAATSFERKKAEAALKQAEAAVQLTKEELELNKRKENVLKEGRIDNLSGLDAYNKGATAVRAEANANDGLVRLMEKNKLKLGRTAADREVANRTQVLIHDREMQQETLEKALALHENKDLTKPAERAELEEIWQETRKANYGRKELGNQIIMKEEAKLRADAAQAQEDKVVNDISRETGISESDIKYDLSGRDFEQKIKGKVGDEKFKNLKDKLKKAREKRKKNLTESGDLVNIENKITNLKSKTTYPGRFLGGEKTVEQYLSETPEQRERREKNTKDLIDRFAYDSGKASDKILDKLQKDDSLIEGIESLKDSYSLDKDGNVISDHQKLFDGLKNIGADGINKLARAVADPGQSVDEIKRQLQQAIVTGGLENTNLIFKAVKKYTDGDLADLGFKKKLNEIISDENLEKFDRLATRKRGRSNFQRAMKRDKKSVIPSSFDQKIYAKFGDIRDTGAELPSDKDIEKYRDLGYQFKTENGITYFKRPGSDNWSKEEMHSLEKAQFTKANADYEKAEKRYTSVVNLLQKEEEKLDRLDPDDGEYNKTLTAVQNLKAVALQLGAEAEEQSENVKAVSKKYAINFASPEYEELERRKNEVAKSEAEKAVKEAEKSKEAWEKQVANYEKAKKINTDYTKQELSDTQAQLAKLDEQPSVKSLKEKMDQIADKKSTEYTDAENKYKEERNKVEKRLKQKKKTLDNQLRDANDAERNLSGAKEKYKQAKEALYERQDEKRLADIKVDRIGKQQQRIRGGQRKAYRNFGVKIDDKDKFFETEPSVGTNKLTEYDRLKEEERINILEGIKQELDPSDTLETEFRQASQDIAEFEEKYPEAKKEADEIYKAVGDEKLEDQDLINRRIELLAWQKAGGNQDLFDKIMRYDQLSDEYNGLKEKKEEVEKLGEEQTARAELLQTKKELDKLKKQNPGIQERSEKVLRKIREDNSAADDDSKFVNAGGDRDVSDFLQLSGQLQEQTAQVNEKTEAAKEGLNELLEEKADQLVADQTKAAIDFRKQPGTRGVDFQRRLDQDAKDQINRIKQTGVFKGLRKLMEGV